MSHLVALDENDVDPETAQDAELGLNELFARRQPPSRPSTSFDNTPERRVLEID